MPEFAERVHGARREERFAGGCVRNWFRTPYGAGWALVGDAGYTKDPITAQGISDAFHDAEACSTALLSAWGGTASYDDAMSAWHVARDQHALPFYEFTTQLATLAPPPPEMQQLLGAVARSERAMDAFVSVAAGAMSPIEFFAPEHIGQVMAAAV